MYTQHPDFELHHVTSLVNGMLAGMTWTEAWNKLAQLGPWQEPNPLFHWPQKNKRVIEQIWTSWSQPKSAKFVIPQMYKQGRNTYWKSLSFRVACYTALWWKELTNTPFVIRRDIISRITKKEKPMKSQLRHDCMWYFQYRAVKMWKVCLLDMTKYGAEKIMPQTWADTTWHRARGVRQLTAPSEKSLLIACVISCVIFGEIKSPFWLWDSPTHLLLIFTEPFHPWVMSASFLLLEVWSLDHQHQQHPGAC